MRLFISEKPMLSRIISETIGESGDYIFSNNSFKYKFDFNHYQQFSNPKYYYNSDDFLYKVNQCTKDKQMSIKGDFLPESFVSNYDLNKVDEIVIATDPDHAGIRAADLTLDLFSKEFIDKINVNFIKLGILSNDGLRKSYENRTYYFKDDFVVDCRKHYQLKDYLDYNFMGIIKIGKNEYNYLTRNMLWLLLMLKDNNKPIGYSQITSKMNENKIGSAASAVKIHETILDNSLINSEGIVTSKGLDLIDKLNIDADSFNSFKNINDLIYSDVSLEQGKISIEIFIKNLFKL